MQHALLTSILWHHFVEQVDFKGIVLVVPNNAGAAFSSKLLTLHHVTDASDLIGSFPQQGSGVVDTDDSGGTPLSTFR